MPQLSTPPGLVLITGGASGLGAAVAAAVESEGGTPIVFDIGVGNGSNEYRVDVSDTTAVDQAVEQVVTEFGDLDGVVTAAGIDRPGRLDEVPADAWERVVRVNLLGTVAVVRAALPSLLKTHGHVVTIASSLGLKAVGGASAYCASKFGVMGFSRSLAAETRGEIDVTTIVPAGMKTHFFDGREEQYKPQDDSKLNDPEYVADAILFAMSQPRGSAVRELVIAHELEESWP